MKYFMWHLFSIMLKDKTTLKEPKLFLSGGDISDFVQNTTRPIICMYRIFKIIRKMFAARLYQQRHCISYLMLHNKLLQNLSAHKNNHLSPHTVSQGQNSGSSLAEVVLVRIFHGIAIKLLSWMAVLWILNWDQKLVCMWDGNIQACEYHEVEMSGGHPGDWLAQILSVLGKGEIFKFNDDRHCYLPHLCGTKWQSLWKIRNSHWHFQNPSIEKQQLK